MKRAIGCVVVAVVLTACDSAPLDRRIDNPNGSFVEPVAEGYGCTVYRAWIGIRSVFFTKCGSSAADTQWLTGGKVSTTEFNGRATE